MKIHTIFSDPADAIVGELIAVGHRAYTHPHLDREEFQAQALKVLAQHVYGDRRPGWLGAQHFERCRKVIQPGNDFAFAHRVVHQRRDPNTGRVSSCYDLQHISDPIPADSDFRGAHFIRLTREPSADHVSAPVTLLSVDDVSYRQLSQIDAFDEIELLDYAEDRRIGDFTPSDEFAIAAEIADRAAALYDAAPSSGPRSRTDILMTIVGVHERCMPLRFADWLAVENDARFLHDIGGIFQNLDRASLQLEPAFCPRFAA